MYPPPHFWDSGRRLGEGCAYDMYPPPHMTCILLLIFGIQGEGLGKDALADLHLTRQEVVNKVREHILVESRVDKTMCSLTASDAARGGEQGKRTHSSRESC